MVIDKLINAGVLKFGEFTLTSGKKSSVYVDLKSAYTDPSILTILCNEIVNKLNKEKIEFERIACIELGGVPIAVALSLKTKKPFVIFRKKRKEHGVKEEFIGTINKDEKILVVDDVTTTGSSVLTISNKIKELGAKVECIFSIVDREEGAKDNIEKNNFKFLNLLTLSDLIKFKKT